MRILEGDLLYRDFWDHKTTGVFYLNALGFKILGGDAWGVWYIAVINTFAIAISFYWFLSRLVPKAFALIGSIMLIATFIQEDFYEGTNLTEFFGLLPTILALIFTYIYFARGKLLALVGLGGAFITGFLFKQTTIATAIICIIATTYINFCQQGIRKAIQGLLMIAIVPALVLIGIIIYWRIQGALTDLWQSTLGYNLIYAEAFFRNQGVI